MGNLLTLNTNEKTQQEIGKASAELNVYTSYVICFVFILIGIGFIIFALTPTAQSTFKCNNNTENIESIRACSSLGDNNTCTASKNTLAAKNIECSIKTRKYWFLLGGLFIPFGLFIIWYSKWWKHKVDTNVGYAHLAGLSAERSILRSVFDRK
jgi:hypothetical protein